MSNMLMMHYASSRGNDRNREQNHEERRKTYDQSGMRMPDDSGAESRYRGEDGRWKAGTRRSEYEQGMRMDYQGGDMNRQYERRTSDGDDEEEGRKYKIEVLPRENIVEWPYGSPGEPREANYRSSRQIGFGAENQMDDDHERSEHMMGRSEDMQPIRFDRQTAEEWVQSMENEDKAHPRGGKWKPDMLKPLAQKHGIPTEGPRFWEFYAMVNAMYSDYSEVAKKFGITSPDYYVCMAKAFMDDKDAEDDKVARYYECIVKK